MTTLLGPIDIVPISRLLTTALGYVITDTFLSSTEMLVKNLAQTDFYVRGMLRK
jgi:hypothetical protein